MPQPTDHPEAILASEASNSEPGVSHASDVAADELAAEDFYYEGPYVVFTSAYHLRRGYCCNSDCRHCPYR